MGLDGLNAATLNMNLMDTSSSKTMAQTKVVRFTIPKRLAKNQLTTELVCSVDVEYAKGDTLLSFRDDDKHGRAVRVERGMK
jgi:hypothetical protein